MWSPVIMAAVKLLHGLVVFLFLNLVATSSTIGLRKRIPFSIKKQESNSSPQLPTTDEIPPIVQQPKRGSFSSMLERMRPRTRTSSSDSISSPSTSGSIISSPSINASPQPVKSVNYFEVVQGFTKVFDIDALQREQEAKAQLEAQKDQSELQKAQLKEQKDDKTISAESESPVVNSHSIASPSPVCGPEEVEQQTLLTEDSQALIESPKQVDFEFTNLGSNLLEDDFYETQKLMDDELVAHEAVKEEDFVLVDIPTKIQQIISKQETFKKITTKVKNSTSLVNQVQTLLIEIVKKIFYNQPPKNAQLENEDSVFVPTPVLTYLTDLEMVELLLSSPGKIPKQELRPMRTMLNKDKLDGKFKITANSALPKFTSFADAKQMLMQRAPEEFKVIQGDVYRTPRVFYRIDCEWKENRLAQASALEKPNSKELSLPARISYVLFYILTVHWHLQEDSYCTEFMSEEVDSFLESFLESFGEEEYCEISQGPMRYTHTQGFNQIAAYFAAKFDLRLAGPLTLRFMERFIPQLLNHQNSLADICEAIEKDALHAVRVYLQMHGLLSREVGIILGIFSQNRVSSRITTILHFAMAPGADELEEYVQFLMTQIPAYLSDSAVAIIFAARILYALPTFVSSLEPIHRKVENMDGLLGDLFLEIFETFGPSSVFPDSELKLLLEYARQLIPIMTDHKTSSISSTKKENK